MRGRHPLNLTLALTIMTVGALVFPAVAAGAVKTPADKYVRIADYYLKAGTGIPAADYEKLAKYDLLILPAEAQVFNRQMFDELRRRNPDIILLAYVPTKSYALVWNDSLHAGLKSDLKDEWKLRDGSGNVLSVWPNTYSLNLNSGWSDYLPGYVADRIMSTGLWDGIFYDEASATISWLNGGNLDLNRDGLKDDPAAADRLWKDGMVKMLKKTRDLLGADTVVVLNGDSDPALQPYVNGRMFETFPTPWEGNGSWTTVEGNYLRLQKQVGYSPVFVINGNSGNTGKNDDYAKVRFGLASALLGGGYFGFDYGDQDHGQTWMYDEYLAYLGAPLGDPRNLTGASDPVKAGLWKRDFQNGIVLLNSTGQVQTADLEADYEKLHGVQDPKTNNGEISSSVDVPPNDGLILLRPIEKVSGIAYRNGTFMRVLDGAGKPVRTGFFAFASKLGGNSTVAESVGPSAATIVAKGNRLEYYTPDGQLVSTAYPFGPGWSKGLNFSVGQAGGKTYVAVGAGEGGNPLVRLFDSNLTPLGEAWNAYAPNFKGGVRVAVGDLEGDGQPELVSGAGIGGGPHVRIFGNGGLLKGQFFAYDKSFTKGIYVAVGDVDGDGRAEIVSGAGFGGGPQVRIFDRSGKFKSQFFAYDSRKRTGVQVAVGDIDGDGRQEIIAMSNDVFTAAAAAPKP